MVAVTRLRAIVIEEGLTHVELAKELKLTHAMFNNYIERRTRMPAEILVRISNHLKFNKYTLWLMTGQINPVAGQVCPSFSTLELCERMG